MLSELFLMLTGELSDSGIHGCSAFTVCGEP